MKTIKKIKIGTVLERISDRITLVSDGGWFIVNPDGSLFRDEKGFLSYKSKSIALEVAKSIN